MNPVQIIDPEATPAGTPLDEELSLVEWGEQIARDSLKVMAEAFGRLVTLDTALLGGSVAFVNERSVWGPARIAVIVLLMLSLLASLRGLLPIEANVDPRKPYDVKQVREDAIASRTWLLRASGALLLLAFAAALVGLIVRAAFPLPLVSP